MSRLFPSLCSCAVLLSLSLHPAYSDDNRVANRDASVGEFVPIFDGETLAGWHGNTDFWSVQDGVIVGKCDGRIPDNTFLISDAEYANFELKVSFRLVNNSGNSGVQFRSQELKGENGDPLPGFIVSGYQADIASDPEIASTWYMGILYEEKGRGIMHGLTDDVRAELTEAVHRDDWNDYVITADGDHITQVINGVTTVDLVDPEGADSGIIALQLHANNEMEIQFRDIMIRELE